MSRLTVLVTAAVLVLAGCLADDATQAAAPTFDAPVSQMFPREHPLANGSAQLRIRVDPGATGFVGISTHSVTTAWPPHEPALFGFAFATGPHCGTPDLAGPSQFQTMMGNVVCTSHVVAGTYCVHLQAMPRQVFDAERDWPLTRPYRTDLVLNASSVNLENGGSAAMALHDTAAFDASSPAYLFVEGDGLTVVSRARCPITVTE